MSPLPVRSQPAADQCITDWLEHVAEDNGLLTTQLASALRWGGGTTRFLAVKPDQRTLMSITELTGAPHHRVVAATLSRFDGTALDLAGLNPQRWSSWRTVAGRGWFRLQGTGACPACLARDGCWRTAWRLPTVTICTEHSCYLIERCPGCGRRFADHPHEPLRHGAGTCCFNPTGERTVCDIDVSGLTTAKAAGDELARQDRHDVACTGSAVPMLGAVATAQEYLAAGRHLAVLLLHLASHADASSLAPWMDQVRREARDTRRVRWHLSPPIDPLVRSAVLTTADQILTAPGVSAAADLLAPWFDILPTSTESRLAWLADHTTMTPALTRLTMAALAPHQRISTHLRRTGTLVDPERIPQVVPEPLFRRQAAHLFTTDKAETNRLFLSLCMARRGGATTWADAAEMLGLDGDLGTRTARSVSARSRPDPRRLTDALDAIGAEMTGNYRDREQQVRALATSDAWFEQWVGEHRPGTRARSFPYAVTYLWCVHAGGLLSTSPAWTIPPARRSRVAYRQFAASLRPLAIAALTQAARTQHATGAV
ncbi:TniQ family protein [Cellulomonas xiejunii]|uniref:TniQ family protein n=1 Tax=Cellulomonas xiejunii TaxID=2968083 RepID=A0ABY5KMX5_9CELL|nr:TniQ family protein [Cellulomonas xiejunii]MCC2321266.1 TniQ family protein [Cellulomonas xiejunii]UUI71854.1 TniQ family protein [Cellulomonas xiejunii]